MKFAMSMAVAGLALAACGGDDDGGGADRMEIPIVDAGELPDTAPTPDTGPVPCIVEADQGALGVAMGTALQADQSSPMTPGDKVLQFSTQLNQDATPDVLIISLWDGYGAFAGATAAPGNYTISGAEASYQQCGVCVWIFADVDAAGDPAQIYQASSGTVDITSVAGNFTGSITNVDFRHIITSTDMDDPDMCQSTTAGAQWDAMIMMP